MDFVSLLLSLPLSLGEWPNYPCLCLLLCQVTSLCVPRPPVLERTSASTALATFDIVASPSASGLWRLLKWHIQKQCFPRQEESIDGEEVVEMAGPLAPNSFFSLSFSLFYYPFCPCEACGMREARKSPFCCPLAYFFLVLFSSLPAYPSWHKLTPEYNSQRKRKKRRERGHKEKGSMMAPAQGKEAFVCKKNKSQ